VVHEHQPIALEMKAPGLLALRAGEAPPARDDFSTESLALVWNFIRNPNDADWSLAARSGWLRLRGTNVSLNDVGSPAFLGRRQQHYRCHASALLEFQPQSEDHQAGLVVRANEKNHHDLVISGGPAGRRARLRTCVKGESRTVAEVEVPDGPLVLTIRAREDQFEFLVATPGGGARSIGAAPTTPLSSEAAGGFTGVYFGMYASAGGSPNMPPADFDWFDYVPDP
jgi:alpha-N-arabinofuranosidase